MSTILYQSQKVTPIVNTMAPLDVQMVDQSICQKTPDIRNSQIYFLQQHRNATSKQKQKQQQVSMWKNHLIANKSTTSQELIQKVKTQQKKRVLKKQKVTFNTVQVREYARCLGDNPSASIYGPSLSIDWMYKSYDDIFLLDEYEQKNKRRNFLFNKSLNDKITRPLDGKSRKILIQMHTDCTDQEILHHMRGLDKVRRQREESNKRLPWFGGSRLFKICKRRYQDEEDSCSRLWD